MLARKTTSKPACPKAKKLTPKQEKFCQLYIQLGNASDAYRGAYCAGMMKAETIRVKAAELLKNGNVTVRIRELQDGAAEKAQLSKAWVLERLMRNARICMGEETIKLKVYSKARGEVIEVDATDRDSTAANRALELLGKELRMFIDRQVVTEQLSIKDYVLGAIARRDARRALS
jgi:phage terminase small subunit